jgi:hypothetical protein
VAAGIALESPSLVGAGLGGGTVTGLVAAKHQSCSRSVTRQECGWIGLGALIGSGIGLLTALAVPSGNRQSVVKEPYYTPKPSESPMPVSDPLSEPEPDTKTSETRPIELCSLGYDVKDIKKMSKMDSAVGHPNREDNPECKTKKVYLDVLAGATVTSPVEGRATVRDIRDERDGMPEWGKQIVLVPEDSHEAVKLYHIQTELKRGDAVECGDSIGVKAEADTYADVAVENYEDDAFTLVPTFSRLTEEAWDMVRAAFGNTSDYTVSEDVSSSYSCTEDPRDGLRYTPETQAIGTSSDQWLYNPSSSHGLRPDREPND